MSDIQTLFDIHNAATSGDLLSVRTLLNNGTSIHFRDKDGCTALHLAAKTGQVEIVKYLVENQASKTLRNNYKRTPLYLAVKFGHIEVVKYLTNNTADVNLLLKVAIREGHVLIAKLYINNFNAILSDVIPYMELSCIKGHIQMIDYLANQFRYNINCYRSGRLLIHIAAATGQVESTRYLVQKHVDKCAKDCDGMTALHHAAQGGHVAIVKMLVQENKFNMYTQNQNGFTPFYLAALNRHICVINCFIHELHMNYDHIYRTGTFNGKNTLHIAALLGHLYIVMSLVEDFNVNVNDKDKDGCTAILLAAQNGHDELVMFLIKHSADVNVIDKNKRTLLHYIIENRSTELALQVINHTACNINTSDRYGRTPLHMAASLGFVHIVQALINSDEAIVHSKDNDGRTPLHLAVQEEHIYIIKLLLKHVIINVHNIMDWRMLYETIHLDNFQILYILLLDIDISSDISAWIVDLGIEAFYNASEIGDIQAVNIILDHIGEKITEQILWKGIYLAGRNGRLDVIKLFLLQFEKNTDIGKHLVSLLKQALRC